MQKQMFGLKSKIQSSASSSSFVRISYFEFLFFQSFQSYLKKADGLNFWLFDFKFSKFNFSIKDCISSSSLKLFREES